MGIWFIIQNLNYFEAMTHEVKSGRATVVPVKASELMRERVKELLRQGVTASGKKVEAKRT